MASLDSSEYTLRGLADGAGTRGSCGRSAIEPKSGACIQVLRTHVSIKMFRTQYAEIVPAIQPHSPSLERATLISTLLREVSIVKENSHGITADGLIVLRGKSEILVKSPTGFGVTLKVHREDAYTIRALFTAW